MQATTDRPRPIHPVSRRTRLGRRTWSRLPSFLRQRAEEIEVLAPDVQLRLLAAVRLAEEARCRLAVEPDVVERRRLEAEVRLGERAFDRLLCANLRLVAWVVAGIAPRFPGVDPDDLVQEGVQGLRRAIEKFDPDRGSLSTYATWWIRQRVTRAAMADRLVHVPIHVLTDPDRWRDDAGTWWNNLNSLEELLAGVEDEACTDQGEDDIADARGVDVTFHVDTDVVGDRMLAEQALNVLTEREAFILRHRVGWEGAPMTLAEVGDLLGLTRERVRQIEAVALGKCRDALLAAA